MPKPQHTFMLVNGKAKVATTAQDARENVGTNKSEQRVNAVDYLLKKAKVEASRLPTGLKILEAARKTSKDRVDGTTLGKVKEVFEAAKDIAEHFEKLGAEEKKATAELQGRTAAVMRVPDPKPDIGLKEYVNALEVVIVFFTLLIKVRAKGTR